MNLYRIVPLMFATGLVFASFACSSATKAPDLAPTDQAAATDFSTPPTAASTAPEPSAAYNEAAPVEKKAKKKKKRSYEK